MQLQKQILGQSIQGAMDEYDKNAATFLIAGFGIVENRDDTLESTFWRTNNIKVDINTDGWP